MFSVNKLGTIAVIVSLFIASSSEVAGMDLAEKTPDSFSYHLTSNRREVDSVLSVNQDYQRQVKETKNLHRLDVEEFQSEQKDRKSAVDTQDAEQDVKY